MSRHGPQLRYAIIGAGALGGLYGGMLARRGAEVHFLVRSAMDQLRRHGWRVQSVWGDFHLPGAELNLHASAETLPPCDVTIVALKTTQNHLLDQLLPPPTRGGGLVLCLQNGLHSEADSAAVVGTDRVLGGCCFLCSNKLAPGHIHHLDFGRIVLGEFTPADAGAVGVSGRAARLADDLGAAGIETVTTGDLWMARWRKLMWNIPFNGLSVALDASTKQLIEDPAAASLATTIMLEVRAAAAACGRTLPEDAVPATLENTRKMVPYDSSMRLDYRAGRAMELKAIFADPLAAASAAGVAMPQVEMLYRQLQFLQTRACDESC